MRQRTQHRVGRGLLLGALVVGMLVYLIGLGSTMQLGDVTVRGFLLVPALPTSMYITMLLVALGGVGMALLASIAQRRRRPQVPRLPEEQEGRKPLWLSIVSTLAWVVLLGLGLRWLVQRGPEVRAFLERLRSEIGAIHESLGAGGQPLVDQVSSPTAGYALFVLVVVIYGSIGLVALWILFEDRGYPDEASETADPHIQRVQRAMHAGLRELRLYADPRQAIIACYARMEHLLADHGMPAWRHLTPQEYMGTALKGLDLPLEAFAGLIRLFELARYSLHPIDANARVEAMTHLERLTAHLQKDATDAGRR